MTPLPEGLLVPMTALTEGLLAPMGALCFFKRNKQTIADTSATSNTAPQKVVVRLARTKSGGRMQTNANERQIRPYLPTLHLTILTEIGGSDEGESNLGCNIKAARRRKARTFSLGAPVGEMDDDVVLGRCGG